MPTLGIKRTLGAFIVAALCLPNAVQPSALWQRFTALPLPALPFRHPSPLRPFPYARTEFAMRTV